MSSDKNQDLRYLNIITDAMRATHLEEDAVVHDGEVGVEELRTHHSVPIRVGRLLVLFSLSVSNKGFNIQVESILN